MGAQLKNLIMLDSKGVICSSRTDLTPETINFCNDTTTAKTLSEAIAGNNFQIQTVQHDYRRVFSTILQDWFGVSNPTLDLTFYNNTTNQGYANNKVSNLIKAENTVPSSCYSNSLLSTNDFGNRNDIVVYPNPTVETVNINSINNSINIVYVYSLDGKLVATYRNPMTSDSYSIDVQNLATGIYTLKVETNNGSFTKRIIVRR